MENNIHSDHSLEEYNKKHGNKNLSKVNKIDADKDQSLLNNKEWWLIGDTYYEIPKKNAWFKNLSKGWKITICSFLGCVVATAIAVPTILLLTRKPTPITSFTVTFNGNGGTLVSGTEVQKVSKISELVAPTYERLDYTFNGWDTPLSTITKDTTVKAQWSNVPISEFTVVFEGNGGTLVSGTEVQDVKNASQLIPPTFSREGYNFSGWDTDITKITSDKVVRAQWTLAPIPEFTVTFNGNGGTLVSGSEVQKIKHASEIVAPTYERTGFTFNGWDISLSTITKDTTVKALWTESPTPITEFTVTFNGNGGTLVSGNEVQSVVRASQIVPPKYKFNEHVFTGWDKDIGSITSATTITAKWNINRYRVNVFANDDYKGEVSGGGVYDYGSVVTVKAVPESNCVFKGWYSDDTYTELLSEESEYQVFVPTSGMDLYAKFLTKEEDWDLNHGIVPVISEDGKTLTYGLYPQTYVANPEQGLIDAGSGKSDEEYFLYNNEYYVKDTADVYELKPYTFHDGVKIENGKTYYFKCEPIKWNIKAIDSNYYTLDCSVILDCHRYDGVTGKYAYSELRKFLTPVSGVEDSGTFYKRAFSIRGAKSYIVDTDLSDVSVYGDKVWVGGLAEYYNYWYSTAEERVKKVTDYALCNHAYMCDKNMDPNFRNGYYWTRCIYTGEVLAKAYAVRDDGKMSQHILYVENRAIGVSPCLRINKKIAN